MKPYYLDHMASTPLSQTASIELHNMLYYGEYGNPSSTHLFGRNAREKIENARKIVADFINAKPEEIIFTSGSTEGIYLATNYFRSNGGCVIVPETAHKALINCSDICAFVDSNGVPDKTTIWNRFDSMHFYGYDKILYGYTLLNNETGAYEHQQDLNERARYVGAFVLCDASAAIGYTSIDVTRMCIDYLIASGEKFGALPGTGFIYKREGAPIRPLFNGSQENGKRAGTENVFGIVSMAAALTGINKGEMLDRTKRFCENRKLLSSIFNDNGIDFIETSCVGSEFIHLYSIAFKNINSESLLYLLEEKGIYASGGSACNAGNHEVSNVMKAMHVPNKYIGGVIRLTFGQVDYTEDDIRYIGESISECVKKLRFMA